MDQVSSDDDHVTLGVDATSCEISGTLSEPLSSCVRTTFSWRSTYVVASLHSESAHHRHRHQAASDDKVIILEPPTSVGSKTG